MASPYHVFDDTGQNRQKILPVLVVIVNGFLPVAPRGDLVQGASNSILSGRDMKEDY